MKKLVYYSVLTILLQLSACSSNYYKSFTDIKSEIGREEFPSQNDYPEADAIVLYEVHDVKLEFTSDWDLYTYETVQRTTKLLKNIEDYASVEIALHSGEELKDIKARTIKKDGTVIEVKDNEFYTSVGESNNAVFYSDRKKVKFTFPSIEKDCIIEFQYTLFKDMPFVMDEWMIQRHIPVLVNEYRLTAPNLLLLPYSKGGIGWNWRYLSYNYQLGEPAVIKNLNVEGKDKSLNTTFVWKLKNIKPFEPEPMMDSYWDKLAYVKFSPSDWEKWDDVSKWYYKYHFKDQLIITNKIKEKAEDLTNNCANETEKIKAIYKYVQQMRYEAIELGQGSITPNLPLTTLEREYGDCKDKSTLLISLLKSIGIESKPVLVLTADEGPLDKTFPTWNFNHMIVKAETKEKKVFWMDPTVHYISLGELPWACEGINVLTINDDGTSILERTPASKHFNNTTDIHIAVNMASDSDAHFDISILYKGELNSSYRAFIKDKTKDEMHKFLKSMIIDDYLNAAIEEYTYSNLDSVDSGLLLKFKFTSANALQKQTDLYMLNIDPFKILSDMGWLEKQQRNFSLCFKYPQQVNKVIDIEYPENNFSIRSLPENFAKEEDDVSYSITYMQSASNRITVNEKFYIKSKNIAPSKYVTTRGVFDNIKRKCSEKVILTAK